MYSVTSLKTNQIDIVILAVGRSRLSKRRWPVQSKSPEAVQLVGPTKSSRWQEADRTRMRTGCYGTRLGTPKSNSGPQQAEAMMKVVTGGYNKSIK